MCNLLAPSALQTALPFSSSHTPPQQRLVLHTNINISIALVFLSFFLFFFAQDVSKRGKKKRTLTPQLLHPQLAQLPLQLEQLLQEQGAIFFFWQGNVGFCWWWDGMNVLFDGFLCVCGWFDGVDRMEKKRKEKKRLRGWACPL